MLHQKPHDRLLWNKSRNTIFHTFISFLIHHLTIESRTIKIVNLDYLLLNFRITEHTRIHSQISALRMSAKRIFFKQALYRLLYIFHCRLLCWHRHHKTHVHIFTPAHHSAIGSAECHKCKVGQYIDMHRRKLLLRLFIIRTHIITKSHICKSRRKRQCIE